MQNSLKNIRKKSSIKGGSITIRVEEKLKFALELAARKNNSSISSVILNAVQPYLQSSESKLLVQDKNNNNQLTPIQDIAWDRIDAIRLVKLALADASLLNEIEELAWRIIVEQPYYWDDSLNPRYEHIEEDWGDILMKVSRILNN